MTAEALAPEETMTNEDALAHLSATAPGMDTENVKARTAMRSFILNRNQQIMAQVDSTFKPIDVLVMALTDIIQLTIEQGQLSLKPAEWRAHAGYSVLSDIAAIELESGVYRFVTYKLSLNEVTKNLVIKKNFGCAVNMLESHQPELAKLLIANGADLESLYKCKDRNGLVTSVWLSINQMMRVTRTKTYALADTIPAYNGPSSNYRIIHPLKPMGILAILNDMNGRKLTCRERLDYLKSNKVE